MTGVQLRTSGSAEIGNWLMRDVMNNVVNAGSVWNTLLLPVHQMRRRLLTLHATTDKPSADRSSPDQRDRAVVADDDVVISPVKQPFSGCVCYAYGSDKYGTCSDMLCDSRINVSVLFDVMNAIMLMVRPKTFKGELGFTVSADNDVKVEVKKPYTQGWNGDSCNLRATECYLSGRLV